MFGMGEYIALRDKEEDALWDDLAQVDLMDIEEVEVMPNAVFA